jgi:hypothetical protein
MTLYNVAYDCPDGTSRRYLEKPVPLWEAYAWLYRFNRRYSRDFTNAHVVALNMGTVS